MFGVFGLFALALVSAGLLTFYGQIHQTVNVEQAVVLTCPGNDCVEDYSGEIIYSGDNLVSDIYTLTNLADTPRDVKLVTSCLVGGEGCDTREVITSYLEDIGITPNGDSIVNSVTPMTNEGNKIAGWSNFDNTARMKSIEITFNQPRNFMACFEYRTDGDLSQSTGDNYLPAITDGLYPYVCLDNRGNSVPMSQTKVINAEEYVEVRMVFGGEGDERFSWTKMYVKGSPLSTPFTLQGEDSLDFVVANKFMTDNFVDTFEITTSVNPVA